jgi:hypothetical protein
MEACALAELPKKATTNLTAPLATSLAAPMARKHTPITIHMGEYGDVDTSLEAIKEQISKSFMLNSINMVNKS